MPYISAHLLLQASSLTQGFLSYMLITSPLTILHSTSLDLLGQSMHIRPATFIPDATLITTPGSKIKTNPLLSLTQSNQSALSQPTKELLALLGLVCFLVALSQSILASGLRYSASSLTTTSDGKRKDSQELGEEIRTLFTTQTHWMTLAGVRVLVTGGLVGWMYIFQADRNLVTGGRPSLSVGSSFGILANRITFGLGMCDMLFWGYLWTVLRDETREVANLVATRRQQEEEDDMN